jgi:predicted transcriptional regulator of viral defense system
MVVSAKRHSPPVASATCFNALIGSIDNSADDLPKRGRMSFSLAEAFANFPRKPEQQVKNALNRLVRANKIRSVWRGYYAIVLPEYGLRGIIPPTEYIDQLMAYLREDYYVALLSAAGLHGSSHHAHQAFQFVCGKYHRPKAQSGGELIPVYKRNISQKYIVKRNVRSGMINISSPELTAADLLVYSAKSGGINFIATVLGELAESMDFRNIDPDFFQGIPKPAAQRLGYLLGEVLDEGILADTLYAKSKSAGLDFKQTPLVLQKDAALGDEDVNRWRVIPNEVVEVDE